MNTAKMIARNAFIGALLGACALGSAFAQQPTPQAPSGIAAGKVPPPKAAANAPATPAPSAEQTAAAKELLKAMDFRKQMRQMMSGMMQSMPQAMEQMTMQSAMKLPPEQQAAAMAAAREGMQNSMKRMTGLFDDDKMMGEIETVTAKTYAKTFTTVELKDLTKFYASPTGKKLMDRQPALMQESMPELMGIMQPRMMKIINELTEEAVAKAKARPLVDKGEPAPEKK
jgi:uncharacterized protein